MRVTEGRRSMSQMERQISEIDEQSLGHFIAHSPWDEKPLMARIRQDSVDMIGKKAGCKALILDECGFRKQGKKSVGVARQYCRSIGKVDNVS